MARSKLYHAKKQKKDDQADLDNSNWFYNWLMGIKMELAHFGVYIDYIRTAKKPVASTHLLMYAADAS
ncbi:hypothetical protein SARC_12098 [Sphaeroforma arctica JP610]|uniref:Uncharacterized protein n=1 Tax=Sphaeroforma arctica JP610 TaxID=667725 RepID=A0A0L0FF21_9EUKA|nr:hypothetical protein SARC_12098 [Sphaeroforma arctica JP610]KNC75374.1 hypothetical protein SARC_12098 [Sphaeroforma arctica JP610]|eukprot:XP_014149276.1 hypothetical protein SARC_12098 [Sphaeroforma arctica JP610]